MSTRFSTRVFGATRLERALPLLKAATRDGARSASMRRSPPRPRQRADYAPLSVDAMPRRSCPPKPRLTEAGLSAWSAGWDERPALRRAARRPCRPWPRTARPLDPRLPMATTARCLAAAYVLEGSRLGGADVAHVGRHRPAAAISRRHASARAAGATLLRRSTAIFTTSAAELTQPKRRWDVCAFECGGTTRTG